MSEKYVVTRQEYWPTGEPVVEVAAGGIDFCNCDALVPAYQGEFKEFDDPLAAVETAIEICDKWRSDGVVEAQIAVGFTAGFTAPFEACTLKEAKQWAEKERKSA